VLTQLRIVDLAIIEEAELSLGPGLSVLTGETGAGKSIIVGAAGLLRGGRASPDLVRSGCKEAVVEALFDLSNSPRAAAAAAEAGVPLDGPELLVRRLVPASGRGRVHINGALSTVAVLRRISGQLLEISGQHEFQLLSDSTEHRQLLDAVGVPGARLEAAAQAHARLRELARDLSRSRIDDRQRSERIDFLRYQLRELSAAGLAPDEDRALEQELARLRRSHELLEAANQGEQELYSGDAAVGERLERVQRRLESLATVEPRLGELASQLDEARVLAEDVALSLRQYLSAVDLDPARLAEVEERLDLIHRLGRKHGRSVAEILSRQQAMTEELSELESLDQRLDRLEAELEAARAAAEKAAGELSAARRKAAGKLGRQVSEQLADLRMEGGRLVPEVRPRAARDGDDPALCFAGGRLGPDGWDTVEFLIATNPGEEPRPLARIASGGELSRVMLAISRVLGGHAPVSTAIYDEVDAGVGGAVADVVGRYLADVARHRQVLCVTHLPQVAAHADAHFHVGKTTSRKRARTLVKPLAGRQRTEELARMLGGEQVTAQARANARQLLSAARRDGDCRN
jgi:DNA repair protein RecN (Recombination protein N)